MNEEKRGRKTLTETQEQYCQLIVGQGMKPLDAMLQIFPNRKTYSSGNQNRLVKEMQKNEKITKRLEELYLELRENEVLGDLYNFDKGVKLLTSNIEKAEQLMNEKGFISESMHRIILSSVQELNRMYGFNLVDKNGKSTNNMSITFIDLPEAKEFNVNAKK